VTKETTRRVLPTATGFAAKGVIILLGKHKVDAEPLLHRAGLSAADLGDRQHRISAAAQSKLLEFAAEALRDSALGLHLAEQTNPREAGLLFYVAAAAKNIDEALALYARYCRIVNEAVRLKLTRTGDGVVIEAAFLGHLRHLARQNVEFWVAATIKGLREIAGRKIQPTRVSLVHERKRDLKEFERFFGCPVGFAAPSDQFALSDKTLALPTISEDWHLLETLRPICDEAARQRNTGVGTHRASVEHEVQKLLPHGKARRHTVAKKLAISTRTLARKLANEGTTYDKVVDQLRRSLALEYIKEPGLSLSQIAWLLGYEGSTSFNHAFRRWTGRSPSAARNQKLLAGPLA
jgi:AraC-like DNA-binding protein